MRGKKIKKAMQARAKMILSEGEEEASRRLVDAGNSFHANDDHADDSYRDIDDSGDHVIK